MEQLCYGNGYSSITLFDKSKKMLWLLRNDIIYTVCKLHVLVLFLNEYHIPIHSQIGMYYNIDAGCISVKGVLWQEYAMSIKRPDG